MLSMSVLLLATSLVLKILSVLVQGLFYFSENNRVIYMKKKRFIYMLFTQNEIREVHSFLY